MFEKTNVMKKIIGSLILLATAPALFAQLNFSKLICKARSKSHQQFTQQRS